MRKKRYPFKVMLHATIRNDDFERMSHITSPLWYQNYVAGVHTLQLLNDTVLRVASKGMRSWSKGPSLFTNTSHFHTEYPFISFIYSNIHIRLQKVST